MMKMQISGNHTAHICNLTVDIANGNLQTRGKNDISCPRITLSIIPTGATEYIIILATIE